MPINGKLLVFRLAPMLQHPMCRLMQLIMIILVRSNVLSHTFLMILLSHVFRSVLHHTITRWILILASYVLSVVQRV